MKDLVIISAIGKNNELGFQNNLIWHLPGDLKFFKENTMNKNIVMGLKTFKSLPGLLKNRNHIVLTHQSISIEGVKIVSSIDELFTYLEGIDDDIYVIGGASLYKELLPFSNKMLITHIEATHEADVYFPSINSNEWNKELIKENEDDGIKYKHYEYRRKAR